MSLKTHKGSFRTSVRPSVHPHLCFLPCQFLTSHYWPHVSSLWHSAFGLQPLEAKGWSSEARDQRVEAREWRPEAGDQRLENRGRMPEAGDQRLEAGGWRLEAG